MAELSSRTSRTQTSKSNGPKPSTSEGGYLGLEVFHVFADFPFANRATVEVSDL